MHSGVPAHKLALVVCAQLFAAVSALRVWASLQWVELSEASIEYLPPAHIDDPERVERHVSVLNASIFAVSFAAKKDKSCQKPGFVVIVANVTEGMVFGQ